MTRSGGVLLHITSLPSPYGIGSMGRDAYEFVDFLKKAGLRFWQILPTTPAGKGDSPYSSYSVFAGNPLFIDLDLLVEQGLLRAGELEGLDFGTDPGRVDYKKARPAKYALLKKAYARSGGAGLDEFRQKHAAWAEDYALFMALHEHFDGAPWYEWPDGLRLRDPQAVAQWGGRLKEEVDFWIFTQALFYRQWDALKRYANSNGVEIIGDIPIYVAMDSADVWAGEGLFQLDEGRRPLHVAGVPPDYFSPTGQLWGNPLYDWEGMARDNYAWWVARVRHTVSICDVTRIDHFRGFDEYYAIPASDKTAENGVWMPGPGMKLFDEITRALGSPRIIAEDLGLLTDSVRALLRESGYPGMKILEFAFDSDWKNDYLPFQYTTDHIVVYTGTHDNDTACGWFESSDSKTRRFARKYLGLRRYDAVNWALLRCAWNSRAQLAVAQMQDFLGLGSEARMNIPAVENGCWSWRMRPGALTDELAWKIARMGRESGR